MPGKKYYQERLRLGMTTTDIARIRNTTTSNERYHLKKYGLWEKYIQNSGNVKKQYTDYVNHNMTMDEIAWARDISRHAAYCALRNYNLLDFYKEKHPEDLKKKNKFI